MTAVAHPAAAVGLAALARRALRKNQGHTTVTVTRVLGANGEVVDVTPDAVVVTTAPEEDPMTGNDWILLSFGVFIAGAVLLTGWLLRQARKHVEQLQADVDELKRQAP